MQESAGPGGAGAMAADVDRGDPLARFRDEFAIPDGQVYLDGNSLGPLSTRAEAHVRRALDGWRTLGIAGWLDAEPPWLTLAEELGRRMAPLVGAEADEVVAAGSTTVNLHQCLATLFRPRGRRSKILIDGLSFPTDRYAVRGHLRLRGLDPATHLVAVPSRDGLTLSEDEILAAMTDEVQLAVLPSVVYHSGQLLDMERLARGAAERGVVLGFDCSHSVGVVPHRLGAWGVDFAVWSTYKYLNGGPGAVAGLFLARRHAEAGPGLPGWFGGRRDRMFAMADAFEPAPGAAGLQIGTPHILSMAALLGALEMIAEAGLDAIRRKSLALTAHLMALVERELAGRGFSFANPREDHRRGGHVALVHPEAMRLSKALRAAGVVPDYRQPDIIRLAPAPLYIRSGDCDEAVARLRRIVERREHERFPGGPDLVT